MFTFKSEDYERVGTHAALVLKQEAIDRYVAHCLSAGNVSQMMIEDRFISVPELIARGWTRDFWSGNWHPDPNHKLIAATRAVARGAE